MLVADSAKTDLRVFTLRHADLEKQYGAAAKGTNSISDVSSPFARHLWSRSYDSGQASRRVREGPERVCFAAWALH